MNSYYNKAVLNIRQSIINLSEMIDEEGNMKDVSTSIIEQTILNLMTVKENMVLGKWFDQIVKSKKDE